MSAINHGTYGGAQKCLKRPEGTCDDCKVARNAYIKKYRAEHPIGQQWEKEKSWARDRALRKLAAKHGAELRALIDEEMKAI